MQRAQTERGSNWTVIARGHEYTGSVRSFVIAMVIFATGCFHYAPVSSLSSVEDDRVRIYEGDHEIEMEHATARGRVIQGEPTLGHQYLDQSAECMPPACGSMDVSNARVMARRVNVPATIAILVASAAAVAATVVFGVIIAFASRPVAIP